MVPLLGSLLAIAYPASASASPRMCFYTEDRQVIGGSASGHAFVQLLPDSGPQAGSGTWSTASRPSTLRWPSPAARA